MENRISQFVVLLFLAFEGCSSGWTDNGGYIGVYPGGCAVQSDCPADERCMHSVDETICPFKHENLCRCTLGCEIDKQIVRYEQWRPLPGKGFCKCVNSITNESYCTDHIDL